MSAHKHRYFYIEHGQRKEELIDGKWVPAGESQAARGVLLIRDQLGEGVKGVFNPATSKRYDSRSAYLRDTKAAGCEVVDGKQSLKGPPQTKVRESVPTTIERLNQQKGWGL